MSTDTFADNILKAAENHQKKKMVNFLELVRENFEKDIEGTARIYTRDKDFYPYKVVSLKSKRFALVDKDQNIIYTHDDVHQCKVEFIMYTSASDPADMSKFTNKL